MPSYVITGGRGLGYEFADQLSADPANVVFSLVRNANKAPQIVALAAQRQNLHVVEADITDLPALRKAAKIVGDITGGTLDVLINNAAVTGDGVLSTKSLGQLVGEEEALTKDTLDVFTINVLGPIYTTNSFLSLLKAGSTKKVLTLSTGIADFDFTVASGNVSMISYSTTKVALNMVNVKYALELKDEGFVFLAVSPGFVRTSASEVDPATLPPEVQAGFGRMIEGFTKVKKDFTLEKDWIAPSESVKAVLEIVNKATVDDTGAFISHLGNKTWL